MGVWCGYGMWGVVQRCAMGVGSGCGVWYNGVRGVWCGTKVCDRCGVWYNGVWYNGVRVGCGTMVCVVWGVVRRCAMGVWCVDGV